MMRDLDRIVAYERACRKARVDPEFARRRLEVLGINNMYGFGSGGGSAASDPYFANVVVLLHFNGADGSTTFTDVKGHTFTGAGNAQIDTGSYAYGGASLQLDGTGDYVTASSSTDWDFGTGDYTIEFWFNGNSFAGQPFVCNTWVSPYPWGVDFTATNVRWSTNATVRIDAAHGISTGQWGHFAVARASSDTRVFIDGVQKGSTVVDSSSIGAQAICIGAKGDTLTFNFNGQVDDLRITKGVARYTTGFSPSGLEFPDS